MTTCLSKCCKFLLLHFDICGFQETHGIFVRAIGNAVYDARNTGVDQCLCAMDAGQVGDITGRAFGRDSVQRGLDDGIRLGMDRADAMSIHEQVTDLIAVRLPGG